MEALSTGVGRAAYYVAQIPTIFLSSFMLNRTGINLACKSGYVSFGLATPCLIVVYFHLPELGGRSYRELDILFHRKVPACKLTPTEGVLEEDE
ncbi:hypothetical protein JCM24511_02098 [Saitozyma sp. JCM 24511]|nr:hypothetical protein JCM24511_02098 [Saitozyma sp. JCM 24511]